VSKSSKRVEAKRLTRAADNFLLTRVGFGNEPLEKVEIIYHPNKSSINELGITMYSAPTYDLPVLLEECPFQM